MLPAWREIYRVTGRKPFVVVSYDYLDTMEGVSYVDVFPFQGHWSKDVPSARAYAMSRWCSCRVIQWWNDTEPVPSEFRGSLALNCRGRECKINTSKWPSYGHSMWERAGFPDERDMLRLTPVFDQRDYKRESKLLDRVWPQKFRNRPLLAYSFEGKSSPFGWQPELWPHLQTMSRHFHLLDMGRICAARIYDMLAILEAASFAIVIDSALLHLIAATKTPYIALTADGWVGSVPKGNCVLNVRYADTIRRLPEIRTVLNQWRIERTPNPMLVSQV